MGGSRQGGGQARHGEGRRMGEREQGRVGGRWGNYRMDERVERGMYEGGREQGDGGGREKGEGGREQGDGGREGGREGGWERGSDDATQAESISGGREG